MTRYAQDTVVTENRSRAEIEHLLERFGATGFLSGWDKTRHVALIAFELRGRRMQFRLQLPDPDDPVFVYKKVNQSDYRERRTSVQAKVAWDQACRERWRALVLLIKAKLAAVEAGIVALEDEFLPNVMLPDGGTVGDWLQPQVERAYQTGQMPLLLPAPGSAER